MSRDAPRPRAALACPHAEATALGLRALEAGGNAIDAVLTAAAMLTVVYPNQCGIGGDAIALVGTPDGQATVINGSGRSAAVMHPANYGGDMPVVGPRSVTVPGVLAVWRTLADTWGTVPLSSALAVPTEAAREGVRIAPGLHRDLAREQHNLANDHGARELFFHEGRILTNQDTLRMPRLSRTLDEIANLGTDAFYRGEIGRGIVDHLKRLGSDLTLEDFSRYQPTIGPASSITFAGDEYFSASENSQGQFFLRALSAVDHIARATGAFPDPLGDSAHVLARILALTAVERDELLADPDHDAHTSMRLLAPDSVRELAETAGSARVEGRLLKGRSRGYARRRGDTVAIVATDEQGNWVSLIQSLFHAFGACVADPATGVLLHNRGASFSLHPESPNRLAPNKRPAHTLMPVLVKRNGVFVGAHGTMGGRAQPQIHTHLALHIASGMAPARVVAQPRWVIGQLEAGVTPADDAMTIAVESGVPGSTIELLRRDGFQVKPLPLPHLADDAGHAQVVRREHPQGPSRVGSDPRADGVKPT